MTKSILWRLTEEITARSEEDMWDDAKLEWSLTAVWVQRDPPGRCTCGHAPVVEHCLLVNDVNGAEVVVGNVCVGKFMGLPSERLFAGLRRIIAEPAGALTASCTSARAANSAAVCQARRDQQAGVRSDLGVGGRAMKRRTPGWPT